MCLVPALSASERNSSLLTLLVPTLVVSTQVIDLIQMFGGDVIKFAGDAIIVAFRPHAEDEEVGL